MPRRKAEPVDDGRMTCWGVTYFEARRDADRLEAARRAAGLTQKDLARIAGCSVSQISQMEQAITPITAKYCRVFAGHLDVSGITPLPGNDRPRPEHDLTGKVFSRYTVLHPIEARGAFGRQEWWYLCRCECGTVREVRGHALTMGNTTSCGCRHRDIVRTHNLTKTRTYQTWQGMRQRCTNPNSPGYHWYGGRGILICDRWNDSFEDFLADMGERPDGLSLDRIDPEGNYEPGNCRWADSEVQSNNTRVVRKITHEGKTMSLPQWARLAGMRPKSLAHRLDVQGIPFADAISRPVQTKSPRRIRANRTEVGVAVPEREEATRKRETRPRTGCDITGGVFGRITVLYPTASRLHLGKYGWWYMCRCECGNVREFRRAPLVSGNTTSCGCQRIVNCNRHGQSNSPTYSSWLAMKARCRNHRSPYYHLYGGRGIKVCERWINSYESFVSDMGKRPDGMTLDRIDNDKDYGPGNCRWADASLQSNNSRRNILYTHEGRTMTRSQWAREIGIKPATLEHRIRMGMTLAEAITRTPRRGRPRREPHRPDSP